MTVKIKEAIGVGRRKTAVATVRLRQSSSATTTINDKKIEDYFPMPYLVETSLAPLALADLMGQFDLLIRVHGGGHVAQAEAVRLAISRAVIKDFPHHRSSLKSKGFLTRDPRKKERKKYGQKGARKRFQFSKR